MTATGHHPQPGTALGEASTSGPAAAATWPAEGPLQLRPTRGTPDLRYWPTLNALEDSARTRGAGLAEAAAARVWAWWLGDAKTTAADRHVAGQLALAAPALPGIVRAAQSFRDAAVRDALQGRHFGQLLDLAAGVPLRAHLFGDPPARPASVIRVEQDPVIVRLLLDAAEPGTTVVAADLTLSDALLDLLTGRGVLELETPVLVLLTMAAHHLSAFQCLHLFDVLHKRLHPGSRLIFSALVADPWTAAERDAIMAAYTATPDLRLHPSAALRDQLTATGWTVHNTPAADGVCTAVADLHPTPQP